MKPPLLLISQTSARRSRAHSPPAHPTPASPLAASTPSPPRNSRLRASLCTAELPALACAIDTRVQRRNSSVHWPQPSQDEAAASAEYRPATSQPRRTCCCAATAAFCC
eukprot:scaffold13527_cov95-Isochrysis_galbana.AAC.5